MCASLDVGRTKPHLLDRDNVHLVVGESFHDVEHAKWSGQRISTTIVAHDRDIARMVRARLTVVCAQHDWSDFGRVVEILILYTACLEP
jgi:hypothetical protein